MHRDKPGVDTIIGCRADEYCQSPPSPRRTCPTCRRSPACASPPPRPASAIPAAPTCCWRCSTRAPPSPAYSPARNAHRRRSNGAATSSRRAKRARAGGQFRQRQCLHRQERARRRASSPPRSPPRAVGCKPAEIFLASTGVIGEPLEARKLRRRHGQAWSRARSAGDFLAAAKAIMTTDTFPKVATAQREHRQERRSPSTASPRAPA